MWNEDKIIITEKYIELLNNSNIRLFEIVKEYLEETQTVFPLAVFIFERIETVIELTSCYRIWDAEIVLRSAMETFIKFMYITTASKEERAQRIDEFWNSLAEINSIKMSEQAKKNLQVFENSEVHRIAYTPLILPEKLEAELRKKWPRKNRKEVEKRWSFSEIINEISSKNKGTPLENIVALSYGYRMSSHVMHGDETGIQIINERNSRPEEEKNKSYRSHYIRLLSDCLAITTQTGVLTMHYLGLEKEQEYFSDILKEIEVIEDLEDKYKDKIFEETYYNKYK